MRILERKRTELQRCFVDVFCGRYRHRKIALTLVSRTGFSLLELLIGLALTVLLLQGMFSLLSTSVLSWRASVARTEVHQSVRLAVEAMAREVAALAKQQGCTRLLNDLREATIPSSASAIYSMPRITDEAGVPPGLRRALVVSAATRDFLFLETVSLNRGHNIRIFTDPEAARAWLA